MGPSAGGCQGAGSSSGNTASSNTAEGKNGQPAAGISANAWKRRDTLYASTEGSLRSLLNKLAPSESLQSIAGQVANHLLEDEAPDELARQLVERVQIEPMFADTYGKLCAILVQIRSGFVFYRHLLARCRATFSQSLRLLMMAPDAVQSKPPSCMQSDPRREECHRLKALIVFMCHLFREDLISMESINDELQKLVCQLPDVIAAECLCKALAVSGQALSEESVQEYVAKLVETLAFMRNERNLRMIFMIEDLLELRSRNWQPRVQHDYQSRPADDRAEP